MHALRSRTALLAFLLLACHPALRAADTPQGLHFSHHDWELACDNTRTCRAAGYHSEEDDAGAGEPMPVSVLLTRKAGPATPVQAELQIANPDGDQPLAGWLKADALTMRIDGKPAGTVALGQHTDSLPLSARQTQALLAAIGGNGSVEWTAGKQRWKLSSKGATAVLLKMDEVQGRLDTPGALVRKGGRDEGAVPPALPVPVIQAAPVPVQDAVRLPKPALQALRAALAGGLQDCPRAEPGQPTPELTVRKLSATRLLVSTPCWLAAYNMGDAYWVANATAPYAPELVTQDATDYAAGKLVSAQKGRGLGDCWSQQEWTWDGKRFVLTRQATSGQCKSVAPGGTWSLPTLVTSVRPAPR